MDFIYDTLTLYESAFLERVPFQQSLHLTGAIHSVITFGNKASSLVLDCFNPLLHVQRAHLQITLWMAADQNSPPDMDMSNFGWEMNAGVLSPCIDPGPTGPPALKDVICSYKKEGLSCTIYCL